MSTQPDYDPKVYPESNVTNPDFLIFTWTHDRRLDALAHAIAHELRVCGRASTVVDFAESATAAGADRVAIIITHSYFLWCDDDNRAKYFHGDAVDHVEVIRGKGYASIWVAGCGTSNVDVQTGGTLRSLQNGNRHSGPFSACELLAFFFWCRTSQPRFPWWNSPRHPLNWDRCPIPKPDLQSIAEALWEINESLQFHLSAAHLSFPEVFHAAAFAAIYPDECLAANGDVRAQFQEGEAAVKAFDVYKVRCLKVDEKPGTVGDPYFGKNASVAAEANNWLARIVQNAPRTNPSSAEHLGMLAIRASQPTHLYHHLKDDFPLTDGSGRVKTLRTRLMPCCPPVRPAAGNVQPSIALVVRAKSTRKNDRRLHPGNSLFMAFVTWTLRYALDRGFRVVLLDAPLPPEYKAVLDLFPEASVINCTRKEFPDLSEDQAYDREILRVQNLIAEYNIVAAIGVQAGLLDILVALGVPPKHVCRLAVSQTDSGQVSLLKSSHWRDRTDTFTKWLTGQTCLWCGTLDENAIDTFVHNIPQEVVTHAGAARVEDVCHLHPESVGRCSSEE